MKTLDDYKAKMTESTSLSDLEKSMFGARDLINNDIEKLQIKKKKLIEKMNYLDKKSSEKTEIRNKIEQDFQQKIIQIAQNMMSNIPKRRGRKPKI